MNIKKVKDVLILVLMEDTLREGACRQVLELRIVLILVLMEDTLRGGQFPRYIRKANAS